MQTNLPSKTVIAVFCFLLLVCCLSFPIHVQATHIRAGEITAKSDTTLPVANRNPLRYFFKLVQYADSRSPADNEFAMVSFGDGTFTAEPGAKRVHKDLIRPDTYRNVYYFEHIYSGPGPYTLVYFEVNRSTNVINMTNSQEQDFVLKTTITIDLFEPINHTPQLPVPPLDFATIGQIFVHNPGAFDADGDSLAFRLSPSQQNLNDELENPVIRDVFGFQYPNNYGGTALPNPPGGPPTFTIDAQTGQLTWNSPGRAGDYNVAFYVEEWRDGRKLGEVLRDMQIRVLPTDNRPPVLNQKDLCVIAGTTISETITATDPDPGNILKIEAFGGFLPPALFSQINNNNGLFSWQTTCTDVRAKPYQVVFRAVDNAAVPLADLKPWNIRVIGPSPTGFTAQIEGGGIRLNWDRYQCQGAEKLYIYRKEGESNFVPEVCVTGVPASTGFVRIGEVNKDQVTFYDNGIAGGLKRGQTYCYTVYAAWPAPGKGESLAAVPACVILPDDVPLLTKVSVTETSTTTGKILVEWTKPSEVTGLTSPLQYRLSRAEGQVGTIAAYTPVFQTNNLDELTFTDTNLNTEELAYTYKIELFHSPGGTAALVDTASPGSSVRLSTSSESKAITLNWTYRVPWDNTARKHLIYRQVGNAFILIDSVDATVNSGTYVDRGTYNNQPLVENQEYCYYVITKGRYSNPRLPNLLPNNSQISCVLFEDVTAPCPPVLSLNELNCDQLTDEAPIQNLLTWVPNVTPPCSPDIAYYTIYYKASLLSEYDSIGFTTPEITTFTHQNLLSFAGCYVVTATDASGNESVVSNEVCKENSCFYFSLPNIFTPNGDNKNDVFKPDEKRPSFIKATKFAVFNRWGAKLYESNADPRINWAGVDKDGSRVPDGVYYYQAEVEFYALDPQNARKTYKGWVEIIR
ncbi:T9SS type B sorting domain-containing protein [Adhaeribacter pallidiroseus]|uniref:Fibronectin type-III domain-containing protein n=1 Tax=Adhaeribacter pallidiroseus TaxID=2072847 RepID=A0A369QNL6_9BACT|nr:gliding motility-associated C-terminal domain-containing protein [Adhaeribacter pallidiroseus]RDC64856.1 hypothetical protein AHMF7616_03477 [Adhaeribacter pallidiroseus]